MFKVPSSSFLLSSSGMRQGRHLPAEEEEEEEEEEVGRLGGLPVVLA